MSYEKPRQRKGYTLTAVQWDKAGRITRTKYEPVAKARANVELTGSPGECSDCGRPRPALQPCRYCGPGKKPVARGVTAAEQTDLFG